MQNTIMRCDRSWRRGGRRCTVIDRDTIEYCYLLIIIATLPFVLCGAAVLLGG